MKKTDLLHSPIAAIALVALSLCGCSFGSDSSGDNGGSSTATLAVDKTITSVVAGQADTITIKALTASSAQDSVTVASAKKYVSFSNPVYTDSTKTYALTVTGASGCLGDDTLTVSSGSGLAASVTVKVTDPLALHLGGLLVRFVNSFDWMWDTYNDYLFGYDAATVNDFRVFAPQIPEGYYLLGSYFVQERHSSTSSVTSDSWRTIVVKDINDSGALAKPTGFTLVAKYEGPGSRDLYVYRPVAPNGYYAMGLLAVIGTTAPDPATTKLRCVYKDYVPQATYTKNGRIYDISKWYMYPIAIPSDATAIDKEDNELTLNPGLYAFSTDSSPSDDEDFLTQCVVLKSTAPVMLAQEDTSYVPTLTSTSETEGSARPVFGRRVVALPWFGFNDSLVTTLNKYTNTPIYRLERDYYYVLNKFRYNQLSTAYTLQLSSKTGVSSSTTKTKWSQMGVEVGPSFGLKIATLALFKLSKEMGFATTESSSEFNETTVTDTLSIPAGKAGGLFQKCDDLKVLRRNGTTGLWEDQVGDTLSVVEGNIVPDEYPD